QRSTARIAQQCRAGESRRLRSREPHVRWPRRVCVELDEPETASPAVIPAIDQARPPLTTRAASRLIAGLLFGVTASDFATFATIGIVMLTVASSASYVPARRAASVDPASALRTE